MPASQLGLLWLPVPHIPESPRCLVFRNHKKSFVVGVEGDTTFCNNPHFNTLPSPRTWPTVEMLQSPLGLLCFVSLYLSPSLRYLGQKCEAVSKAFIPGPSGQKLLPQEEPPRLISAAVCLKGYCV